MNSKCLGIKVKSSCHVSDCISPYGVFSFLDPVHMSRMFLFSITSLCLASGGRHGACVYWHVLQRLLLSPGLLWGWHWRLLSPYAPRPVLTLLSGWEGRWAAWAELGWGPIGGLSQCQTARCFSARQPAFALLPRMLSGLLNSGSVNTSGCPQCFSQPEKPPSGQLFANF